MSFKTFCLRVLTSRTHDFSAPFQKSTLFSEKFCNLKYQNYVPSISFKTKEKIRKLLRTQKITNSVELWSNITVKELANIFKCSVDTIKYYLPHVNKDLIIKPDTQVESSVYLSQIAKKFGKKCVIVANPLKLKKSQKTNIIPRQPPSKPENLVPRPPVVTVMGHVDHGKTTLLDSLRNSFVVEQEFGGITQHIGAFSVEVRPGKKITFIDTPGHAAFTTMRSRGAEVTDLVILVIAADDGIMEQTIESIKIARRAKVDLIVAVNKIDKPRALSVDIIKEKLLEEGIQVEDKGGEVQLVPISALKKINLDLLVEVILLQADLMNLKGDPTGLVEGVVIESKTDKKGLLATVIIKRGTLKRGNILLAGNAYAKVRQMLNENGEEYNEVLPSTPVQILGWRDIPSAGDEVLEVESEKEANKIIKLRKKAEMEKKIEEDSVIIKEKAVAHQKRHIQSSLEYFNLKTFKEKKMYAFEKKQKETQNFEKTGPVIYLIIKGDVHGSVEALTDILNTYEQHDECELHVLEASVGNITLKDLKLAEVSNAIIYCFNVGIHPNVKETIKEKKIDVRFYNIIYKLFDDLKAELNSKINPKDDEEILGEAEVLEHFSVSVGKKKVPVAGSKCVSGELVKDCLFKVIRKDEIIFTGPAVSLRHLKTEVKVIKKGVECGLMLDNFSGKFEPGDKIISFKMIKVPQTTSWNPGF